MKPAGPHNEFMQTSGDHAYDFNGDGWPDVISASWFSDTVNWYENPGKEGLGRGEAWKEHLAVKGHPECEGTLLTDLDADGVPELIIDQWNSHHPQTVVRIKPGQGGAATEFQVVDIGAHSGHGIAVGDVNGDGRLDLVLEHGWYEAGGAGPPNGSITRHSGSNTSACLAWWLTSPATAKMT